MEESPSFGDPIRGRDFLNPGFSHRLWIPAFAGMTIKGKTTPPLRVVVEKPLVGEGIPIIEWFTVGTGLRACPDEGQPRRAGQPF